MLSFRHGLLVRNPTFSQVSQKPLDLLAELLTKSSVPIEYKKKPKIPAKLSRFAKCNHLRMIREYTVKTKMRIKFKE